MTPLVVVLPQEHHHVSPLVVTLFELAHDLLDVLVANLSREHPALVSILPQSGQAYVFTVILSAASSISVSVSHRSSVIAVDLVLDAVVGLFLADVVKPVLFDFVGNVGRVSLLELRVLLVLHH